MAGTALASFPNSRIKPRSATRERTINILSVPQAGASPNGNTSIAPNQNGNRTSVTIANEGPSDIRYNYFDDATMATTGFLLPAGSSVDEDDQREIFAKSLTATASQLSVSDGVG